MCIYIYIYICPSIGGKCTWEFINKFKGRSWWQYCLTRRSAGLLGLWVRISLTTWMFDSCVAIFCAGSGISDGLISRSEESYRVSVFDCVWSRNLKNEAVEARFWVVTTGKKKDIAHIVIMMLEFIKKMQIRELAAINPSDDLLQIVVYKLQQLKIYAELK